MMYNPQRTLVRLFGGKSAVQSGSLPKWQLLFAGLLGVEAAALLVLSTSYDLPVYVSHLTGDTLQTKLTGQASAAQALTELFRVNMPYLLAAMLLATALIALLFATLYRSQYIAMVKQGRQPLRWLLVAIAGCLMFVALGLLADVRDFSALLMMVVSVAAASVIMLVLEQLPARRGQARLLGRFTAISAAVLAFAPLLIILITLVATNIFGSVSVPGYLWWLFVTVLAGVCLVGINTSLTLRKRGKWSSYAYSECWFVILIAFIETIFVWQVFAAALHA